MRDTFLLLLCAVIPIAAQTFSSGSNGSDGPLDLTTPGTVTFDPKTLVPPRDLDGDGIYHFTTINIATGVTVKFRGDIINSPVVWLAQGAVQINGTIDASGQNGFAATSTTQRTFTIPGPGGFGGGYPAIGSNPPGPGLGPAGGAISGCEGWSNVAFNGGFTGNQFVVPLIGGSGGGGNGPTAGGAGGGAILVARSVSITGTGSILARGGNHLYNSPVDRHSGGGAGGAIRLARLSQLSQKQGANPFRICTGIP